MRNYERQTRRMKEFNDSSPDNERSMFESMSNDPRLGRFSSGQIIGSTVLTIVDRFPRKGTYHVDSAFKIGQITIPFGFNLKKPYEVFLRSKNANGSYKMLPTIDELGGTIASINYIDILSVTEKDITLDVNESGPLELEIYFVDFTV